MNHKICLHMHLPFSVISLWISFVLFDMLTCIYPFTLYNWHPHHSIQTAFELVCARTPNILSQMTSSLPWKFAHSLEINVIVRIPENCCNQKNRSKDYSCWIAKDDEWLSSYAGCIKFTLLVYHPMMESVNQKNPQSSMAPTMEWVQYELILCCFCNIPGSAEHLNAPSILGGV